MPEITFDPLKDKIIPLNKLEYTEQVQPLDYIKKANLQSKAIEDIGNLFPIKSKYDTGIQESDLGNIENYRGEQQPWEAQLGAGIGKMGVIALTSAANTFVGLPYGMAQAIGEGRASALWDNDVNRGLDKINEWSEKAIPNYYTDKERNASAFSPDNWATMNFFADKLVKNAGFTVGAIGSGAITAKAIQGLGKIAMAGKFESEIAKVTELANKYASEGMKETQAWSKAMEQASTGIKLTNNATKYGAAGVATSSEASIEALGAKQDFVNKETQSIQDKKLKSYLEQSGKTINDITENEYNQVTQLTPEESAKIDDYGNSVGNTVMVGNMGILMGSDLIQFGRVLKGFKDEQKQFSKSLGQDITRNAEGRFVAEESGNILNKIKPFKGFITEASEEGSQTGLSSGAQDYYMRKYDNNGEASVNDLFQSVKKGFETTFGTKEGQESMLLGALTGGIFGTATGEIKREFKNQKENKETLQNMVENMNKYTPDPLVKNAIRSASIQKDMDKNIQEEDQFNYTNNQHDLLKSYVQSRIEAGRGDILENELDELKDLSPEEFQDRLGFAPTDIARKSVTEYVEGVKKQAKEIENSYNAVQDRFVNTSPEVKEVAFDTVTNIKNRSERIEKINNTLNKAIVPELQPAIENYINNVENSDKTLQNIIDSNQAKFAEKDILDVYKQVEDLKKLHEDITKYAEKYKQLISPTGVEEVQNEINNKVESLVQEKKEQVLQEEGKKFNGRGQRIINKETGEIVGKAYKIGKDYRIYTQVNEKGRPIGDYQVIDPMTENFQNNFDIHSEDVELSKKDLTTPQTRRLQNKIESFKSPNELIDYINTKIKPLNLSNEDLIMNYAGEKYKQLTGEELQQKDLKLRRIKENRVENLEELIQRKEKLHANKTYELQIKQQEVNSLKEELNSLEQSLIKKDNRSTTNSKMKILDNITSLQKTLEESENKLSELIEEQSKLVKNINFLYERLNKESDKESQPENYEKQIKDIEDNIQENEGIIIAWKDFINETKKLLNNLLNFFGLGKIYNEQTKDDILNEYAKEVEERVKNSENPDKKFGKQMAFAISKVNKLIQDIKEGKKEFTINSAKITTAYNQIANFEKANNDLYDKLSYLEEEVTTLKKSLKQKSLSKAAVPIISKKNTKDITGITDVTTVPTSAIISGDVNDNTIDPKDLYPGGSKRSLKNLFRGLSGNFLPDGKVTKDASQRAYYRFVNKTKLQEGKYFVKAELGEKRDDYSSDIDNQTILMYVVDNKGRYIDEDGKVTTKDKGVYTSLLTSESTYLTYENKDKEVLKKEADLHYQRRENIINKLKNNEEVVFQIIDKSLGIPRTNKEQFGEGAPITRIITKDIAKNWTLKVSTLGGLTKSNGESIKTKNGFVYAEDNKTGNLIKLNSRKLNEKEINIIVDLFKSFLNNHTQKGDFLLSESAGIVISKNKKGEKYQVIKEDGKALSVFDVISNIVFWTGDNLNKEGKTALENAIASKNKENITAVYENKDYLINKNDKSRFHFIPSTIPGGEIRIGENTLQLFVKDPSTGEYVANQLVEKELTNFLQSRYVQIDSALLNNNRGYEKVNNIKFEDGDYVVELDKNAQKQGGYKYSLINDEVLSTDIIPEGVPDGFNNTMPTHINQYAIIDYGEMGEGVKLEKEIKPSKEESKIVTPTTSKIDTKYINNLPIGTTINAIKESGTVVKLIKIDKGVESIDKTGSNPKFAEVINKLLSGQNVETGGNVFSDISELAINFNIEETKKEITPKVSQGDFDLDAELAQFEKEVSKPKTRKRINYRLASENKQQSIDISKAREFIEKTFGNKIEFNTVNRLINDRAWGMFKDSAIYIYENAEIGTEYHEAFHAVFNKFLTPNQQLNLIKEYRKSTNSNSSVNEIEESLAEDFRNYVLTGNTEFLPKIEKNFFIKLLNFIKEFIFGKSENIQGVYDKLKSGYYAAQPFVNQSEKSYYRSIEGFNILDTKNLLNGINYYFFNDLFKNRENIESLFDKSDNKELVNNLYNNVKDNLQEDYEYILREITENRKEDSTFKDSEKEQSLKKEASLIKKAITSEWENLKIEHSQYLKRYKLEILSDEKDVLDSISEENKTKDSNSIVPKQSLKFGTKLNASKNIKLLIGSLPKLEVVDGEELNVINDAGLPVNEDFGKIFNILTNKLANLTSWEDMKNIMEDLSQDIPSLNVLLNRLGANKPYTVLTSDEINQRIQFVQTFAKNNNNFIMQLIGADGDVTYINSNQNTFEKRIKQKWFNNLSKLKKSNFYKSINGNIEYNVDTIKEIPINNSLDALKFLHILGIQFTNNKKVVKNIKIVDKAKAIKKLILVGNQPIIFSKEEDTNVGEDLKFLMDIEASTAINNIENSFFNIEGEMVYGATLNSYVTLIINEINNPNIKNKEDLYIKLPHLRDINSKVIDSLFDVNGERNDKKIEYSILEGSKEVESEVSKSFSDLKIPDKLQNMINLVLQGKYNLLRPSDNSIERVLDFGTFFSMNEIAEEEHLELFKQYLKDELQTSKNILEKGSEWSNVERNYDKGVILHIIKSFDLELYNNIVGAIRSDETIEEIVEKSQYSDLIETVLESYIDLQKKDVKQLLEDNKIITYLSEDKYKNNGLLTDSIITEKQLETLLTKFVVNSLVGNIEQLKVLVGNPQLYKSIEDEFKRHSGAVGTKKISVSDNELENWIKDYFDEDSKIKQQYAENGEPIIRTTVINDVFVKSQFDNEYKKIIGDKEGSSYSEINEADAQGYIHLSEYRRMLFRAGDWSFGKGSLEEKYQYILGKKVYTDFKTGETFPIDSKRVEKVVFNPLKPQHFGPLAEEGFINSFYKLSVFPLIPNVIKGTNLEELNKQMELQNTGIMVFSSGNKVGTKLNNDRVVQPLYSKDGKFLYNENNNFLTQDTYYKYWGIQVDMGNKSKTQVVSGTQMTKQIINGLSEYGNIKPQFKENVNKYLELNKKRIYLGLEQLKDELGIVQNNEGNYIVENADNLIEKLKDEAISRDLPLNFIEGLEYIRTNGIDVLPNREKVENILFALADKMTISQKRFGGSKVQVASTMFETKGVRETKLENGKTYLTSSDLKFYSPTFSEDGSVKDIKSMEVYLPNVFKSKIPIGELDPKLLDIIGFRIPTQGLNSIESIIVKDFLPEEAGDCIVVPTELVVKVGSDFDIDKLNIYISNFYKNSENIPTYISKEVTYENYVKDVTTPMSQNDFQKLQVENEMLEIMKEFVLHPDNAIQLLTPNSAEELKYQSYYIKWLEAGKKGTIEDFIKEQRVIEKNTPYNKIVETRYLLDANKRFLEATTAVGITAIHSTFHILAQMYNIKVGPTYTTLERNKIINRSTEINLLHNTQDSNIALGGLKSTNSEDIANSLSQWINAAVDAAKDPFMFDLNAGPQTLNTVLYLSMAGVPKKTISLFMCQPIIKEYISNQEKYESMAAEANGFKEFKNELINLTLRKFDISKSIDVFYNNTKKFTNEELEKNIINKQGKDQGEILADFLRYQETSKFIGDAIKGASYDTGAAGKNISEMKYKLALTQKVINDGITENYEELIKGENSFMNPYYNTVKEFEQIFEPLFKTTLQNKGFKLQFDKLLNLYFRDNINIPKDDIVKIMDKFKQDFIVYLVSGNLSKTGINNEIKKLFEGENSLPNRLLQMQSKYKNNLLLQELVPIFPLNSNRIRNIKIFSSKLDTIEHNQLTEAWEELFSGSPEEQLFAEDLLKFIILQSGLQNSPINFINLAPVKAYHNLISNTLESENVLQAMKGKSYDDFYEDFFLNNYNDDSIIPKRKIEGFPFYKSWGKPQKLEDGRTVFPEFPIIRTTIGGKEVKYTSFRPIKNFRNNSSLNVFGIKDMIDIPIGTSTKEVTDLDWTREDNNSPLPFCNK